ncbi:unnamed protein product [Adineta steineri]|uniref:Uncharacterized protein n=1 Tax=Adineta steineri TaxID=433720 RepID=A0A819JHZ7_9BILA|nr:unnamed protein product [Adineta steineri]CAF3930391.1 unnamed protein product [Adineta steineri]
MAKILITAIAVIFILMVLAESGDAFSRANRLRFLEPARKEKHINKRSNNYVQCWTQYGGKGNCCGTVDTRNVNQGNIDNHCTVTFDACCKQGADKRCHWQFGAACP